MNEEFSKSEKVVNQIVLCTMFLEHTKLNFFTVKGVDMDVDVVHFAVQLRTEEICSGSMSFSQN